MSFMEVTSCTDLHIFDQLHYVVGFRLVQKAHQVSTLSHLNNRKCQMMGGRATLGRGNHGATIGRVTMGGIATMGYM